MFGPWTPPPVQIIPSCWEAFSIFCECSTQWRVGMAGAVGLDYNVVKWLMELRGVKNVRQTLNDIRTLEGAALEVINHREDK